VLPGQESGAAQELERLVRQAIEEDLGAYGDLTSADPTTSAWFDAIWECRYFPENLPVDRATGSFVSRCEGILAGTAPAALTFRLLDRSAEVVWDLGEGEAFGKNTRLGTVRAGLPALFAGERTALDFLCHLSGVATAARRLVEAAKAVSPSITVRDTRKTLPGLRLLEKSAAAAGGIVNHRMSLRDGILLKDNHLALLQISRGADGGESGVGRLLADGADKDQHGKNHSSNNRISASAERINILRKFVDAAKKRLPGALVEIEADNFGSALEAAEAGADVVLLDNMSPSEIRRIVEAIGGRVKLEASGGIDETNIAEYAATGVDFIAVGSVTHSARACDISLEIGEDR